VEERPDLGFLLDRLLRSVIGREEPILKRYGLTMWDYAILAVLGRGPVARQADLAQATGRDKTRLITNLDRLEERGLVLRTPDPADRRNHSVSLTAPGEEVLRSCRQEIHRMEEELLASVDPVDRAGFERALSVLVRAERP
jgi:DNA-binding MarR family transcriptional regulator